MKQTLEKILFEIYKNFKLIFRNWSSLALIVIAPLILILLVGYSFSGEKLHDINIGVIADQTIDLSELQANVSEFAVITRYAKLNDCIFDMILEKSHICLEISGTFEQKEGEIPFGEVKFYYDNTRKRVSILLIEEIKDYFGLTSERISIISTQTIFSSIQNLLAFLNERTADIDAIKNESENIRADLIKRKSRLVETRDNFTPKYLLVKAIQSEVHYYADSFNNASSDLLYSINTLKPSIIYLRQITGNLNENNLTINLSIINITNTTDWSLHKIILDIALDELETRLDNLENNTNITSSEINNIRDSIDSVVAQLDDINLLLNDEINRTDDYLLLINQSLEKIDTISSQAKEKMQDLSKLDPALAAKIIRPITQSFESLIKGVRDVQMAFPMLLSTIIIFISMIFSNIIALLEINSKAYTRNILAPVNDIIYTLGILITSFIIIMIQVAVLLLVAQYNFNVAVAPHLSEMLWIIVVLVLTFISIGMIIAYISKTMQNSILIATFVSLAFFLFSDALNALEIMPRLASQLAVYNPFVVVNGMFRMIIFFDAPLSSMQSKFLFLLLWMVASLALLVYFSKKKNRERF